MTKFISNMYFYKTDDQGSYSNLRMNWTDALAYFKCCCKLSTSQKQFKKGKTFVEQDLDLIYIVQTIQKLKATMNVMIQD